MKTTYILLLFFFSSTLSIAQVNYETIFSKYLQSERKVKIQLPRNYTTNTDKSYPVFIVFDGDYLFEPVAGNVDYFSYWEDIPEAIVIGIMQNQTRDQDSYYDDVNFLPAKTGANFFEFVGLELMPYIDNKYRTAKFVIAVGHDVTSSFINNYLFKDTSLFQGYLNLSPDFAPLMDGRIRDALNTTQQKIWFYMATGSDDIKPLRDDILYTHDVLKDIDRKNINYFFDDFKGATHYSLVGRAIPKALEDIFSVYRPISNNEYKNEILVYDGPLYQYLQEKYSTIQDLFGLQNQIRINDFQAIAAAIEKLKQWNDYEELGKMARREHPETMLGPYYLARFYEETGNPKKAMRTYQSAFQFEEVANLTKDLMLDRASAIKADFGY